MALAAPPESRPGSSAPPTATSAGRTAPASSIPSSGAASSAARWPRSALRSRSSWATATPGWRAGPSPRDASRSPTPRRWWAGSSRSFGSCDRQRSSPSIPAGSTATRTTSTISAHATAAFRRATAEPGGPTTLYHQALAARRSRAAGARCRPSGPRFAARRRPSRRSRPRTTSSSSSGSSSWPARTRTSRREIDVRPVLDRKLAAFACHASQIRQDWSAVPREMLEAWMGRETFIRVEPPPLPGERETALRGVV